MFHSILYLKIEDHPIQVGDLFMKRHSYDYLLNQFVKISRFGRCADSVQFFIKCATVICVYLNLLHNMNQSKICWLLRLVTQTWQDQKQIGYSAAATLFKHQMFVTSNII